MVGAEAISTRLFGRQYVERAIDLMRALTPDDYTSFLIGYFSDGIRRFGSDWRYADIVTVLLCLAELLAPRRYLESAAAAVWPQWRAQAQNALW